MIITLFAGVYSYLSLLEVCAHTTAAMTSRAAAVLVIRILIFGKPNVCHILFEFW
jgi:hypothetical protein